MEFCANIWKTLNKQGKFCIIKRIEVRTRLAVFTNRQCERDNGRLSVNSLAVIQIIRQAGVLLSKE